MYKVLASAEVWHAGIQLCCRDEPEVTVTARVCVFLGSMEAGQALEEASLSVKGSGSKGLMLVPFS